jgi:hypothetical protein
MSLPSEIQSMKEDRYQEKMFNKIYNVYLEYQGILAGQSIESEEKNQGRFEKLCEELGENPLEMFQECENYFDLTNTQLSEGV